MRQKTQPRRGPRWIGWGVGVAAFAGVIVSIAGMLQPRHETFIERRGPITSATVSSGTRPGTALMTHEVRLTTATGLEVDLRVLRPADTDRPMPAIILLGGNRRGRDTVDLIDDPGRGALVSVDYPFRGPRKIRGVFQFLRHLPAMRSALLDTPPALCAALDWLVQQPWVDASRVELAGVSLGVPFAVVAGATDERFRRVWVIHGALDNRQWLESTLRSRITNQRLRWAASHVIHTIAHGASFRTADWLGQIAPRPVIVVGAREDESIPQEQYRQVFEAAGEPRELLWTDTDHVRSNRPDIVQAILALVRERLGETPAAAD